MCMVTSVDGEIDNADVLFVANCFPPIIVAEKLLSTPFVAIVNTTLVVAAGPCSIQTTRLVNIPSAGHGELAAALDPPLPPFNGKISPDEVMVALEFPTREITTNAFVRS